jgi:hypothetical protein
MAPTTSSKDAVWPEARDHGNDGSVGCPAVPAGWKTNRPVLVDVPGFRSWTDVLKKDPKLPGVEPTTGM